MVDELTQRIRSDLPEAMAARDRVRVSVLRTTLAAVDNAAAVPHEGVGPGAGAGATEAPRRVLSADTTRRLIAGERDGLLVDAATMRALGRPAEADVLVAQAAILDVYLAA